MGKRKCVMRRLFWPCVVVLGVLVVAQVVSLGQVTWIDADRSTRISLSAGVLRATHSRMSPYPERLPPKDTTARPWDYVGSGFDSRFADFPKSLLWDTEIYRDTRIFVPKGGQVITDSTRVIKSGAIYSTGIIVPVLYLLLAWSALSFLPIRAWVVHRRRVKRRGVPQVRVRPRGDRRGLAVPGVRASALRGRDALGVRDLACAVPGVDRASRRERAIGEVCHASCRHDDLVRAAACICRVVFNFFIRRIQCQAR